MPNHASAQLIGHLGKDPETRTTKGGTLTFNATLAVNTGFGDNKLTTWWKVTAFGKTAETLERFNLVKGSPIMFVGEPYLRPWKDKDGNERQSLELSASSFTLMESKADREGTSKPASPAKPKQVQADAPFDDEIPF